MSYRREDTAWIAGRIHDRLKAHYGADNVFMDIDSIPFGLDFREHIHNSLERCDILVAIIGPRWAAPNVQGQLRICEETDWVRTELAAALAKKIPVIPVLIDGAKLPSAHELPEGVRDIVFRQAADLNTGRDFHPHMDRLIEVMDQFLGRLRRAGMAVIESAGESTKAQSRDTAASSEGETHSLVSKPSYIGTFSWGEKPIGAATRDLVLSGFWALTLGPSGRISRTELWAAAAVSFVAGVILWILAQAIVLLLSIDVDALRGGTSKISTLVEFGIWAWFLGTAGIKRLHDRNRNAWWIAVLIVLPWLTKAVNVGTLSFGVAVTIFGITLVLQYGLAILFLVELGLLKGTAGPNCYGPDPLGRAQVDARL